jgi:hypothetical protein
MIVIIAGHTQQTHKHRIFKSTVRNISVQVHELVLRFDDVVNNDMRAYIYNIFERIYLH